ncbi:MAG: UDP-3-O-(3-hydroxymyristoyl)glucosamine N-acyltransferase [Oleibacter sp.]|nr:UDP-3-O-(3-hydroxymyristoyl)glucosamine N-acyltransferase [Thalassolituus sp.]
MQISLSELSKYLDAELRGDDLVISGVGSLSDAAPGQISFLANSKFKAQLKDCKASAVIVRPGDADSVNNACLICHDPYLAYARISQLFDNRARTPHGIHPKAVVAESAIIGNNTRIAANVVIGEHVRIGDDCEIGAGTVIGDFCELGDACHLNANVTLYHDVQLGHHVRIHSGSVIGADGFGFAPKRGAESQEWEKIIQLGGVRIGNHVEIGANTCVDRGAIGHTVIGDHVILDNFIQIAHNVELGAGSAAAAQVGIAGSVKIGKNCTLGGNSGFAGHITICDNTHIGAKSTITKSITVPGAYASGTAQMPLSEWRKAAARFRNLDDLAKRIHQLEKSEKS